MVRCVILEETEIKELKFRLVKTVDFTALLEKKTTNKAEDFKLVKKLEFNNNFIHIYGYMKGEEEQVNVNCIPDIEETLYGDIIVCKFVNDSCVDISVEEYEDIFIQMLEYGNNNEKELTDMEDIDEEELSNIVINNDHKETFFPEDDIDDIIYEDDFLTEKISIDYKNNIDLEKLQFNKVNIELEKEDYDYSYLK